MTFLYATGNESEENLCKQQCSIRFRYDGNHAADLLFTVQRVWIRRKCNLIIHQRGQGEIRTGSYEKELLSGIVPIKAQGYRRKTTDALYSDEKPVREEVTITMIPYYAWGNRGLTQMRVWMPER